MTGDQTIQAVYENGVLRPLKPLSDLNEGQLVYAWVRPLITDPEEIKRRRDEVIRRMEEQGMIEHFRAPAEPPPKDWKPLVLEGEPLSETIIRMRGEDA
jgi:predicted DNA-binding antitoxin AbrB/MazE fold protein